MLALVEMLSKGSKNPGIGSKFLAGSKGIHYLRSRNEARIFIRKTNNGAEIVGYANKANETKVINELTFENIKNTIDHLIAEEEFHDTFEKIEEGR